MPIMQEKDKKGGKKLSITKIEIKSNISKGLLVIKIH